MVYSGRLPVPSLLDGVMMALLELEKVLEVGTRKRSSPETDAKFIHGLGCSCDWQEGSISSLQ